MSPLITSSRIITTPTTFLPRPVAAGHRETWETLEWDDGRLILDHRGDTLFWRTMAGSTLLRNGSKWVWLEVMWHAWTWWRFMWQVVISCTCSVASSNVGSIRMHTPTITAQLGGHMTQLTVAVDVLPLLLVHLHGVGLKVTALSIARHLEGVREREPPLNWTEETTKGNYVCKDAHIVISLALFSGRSHLRDFIIRESPLMEPENEAGC